MKYQLKNLLTIEKLQLELNDLVVSKKILEIDHKKREVSQCNERCNSKEELAELEKGREW